MNTRSRRRRGINSMLNTEARRADGAALDREGPHCWTDRSLSIGICGGRRADCLAASGVRSVPHGNTIDRR